MSDLVTPAENVRDLLAKSKLLDEALDELKKCAREWANAKHELAKAKALAYAVAKSETTTEAGRRRIMNDRTIEESFRVDMADSLRESASLDVKARIAQLSAGQTIASTVKTEMQMAGRYE